jgi:hypothetical protein
MEAVLGETLHLRPRIWASHRCGLPCTPASKRLSRPWGDASDEAAA